jgi:hypothetical protein
MQLSYTQVFQITPLSDPDLVTPSVYLDKDTTSLLALVPATKLAQLEARLSPPCADSEDDISDREDISGSDSDPADPEYLPKDRDSFLASDSSGDEVILTLPMQLFNSFVPSRPQ